MTAQPSGGFGDSRHDLRVERVVRALGLALASMILLCACWVVLLGFELAELRSTDAAQAAQVQTAQRVRSALDSMATSLQQLARSGNVNAKALVEDLAKQGVSLSLNSEAPGNQATK